ncbi:Pentafunctional AROM polypeptide [Dirofilaria immitis]
MNQYHGCFTWCRGCLRNMTTSNGERYVLIMHRSKRSFEMVLQEVCVQHLSVETMRNIHQTELSKASKDDTADHCNNYYNNNNNNDEDFLSARKTIIHDDSIRLPTLIEIPESFHNQNIQRSFS